jgi:hypothetical protein
VSSLGFRIARNLIYTGHSALLRCSYTGDYNGLGIWLGRGDKQRIQNFGGETSWKKSTCKTEDEIGG